MWNHFEFANGSNPYITKNNKAFFDMLCRYNVTQLDCNSFRVDNEKPRAKRSYNTLKGIIWEFAIDWQYSFSELVYSYGELAEWQGFFSEYGRKYGLLTEFHENAIC